MKTALIIIDMQKGFINENTKHLIPKIVNFVKEKDFDLVIGTRYINTCYTACHIYEGWNDCWEGSESAELVPEIESLCDVVVDKHEFSCWNSLLKSVLKRYGIEKLVFCGVNTSCCVLASVFDAYDELWDVTVVESLCGSTSGSSSHEAGIQILRECITQSRVIQYVSVGGIRTMSTKFSIGQSVYNKVEKRGSYEPSVCVAFSRLKIDSIESTSDGTVYVCGMNGYHFKESELMSVDEYKSSL